MEASPLVSTDPPQRFPLFIIGMARSGTQLLLTLLNNHPKIFIPGEINFIPGLLAGYGFNPGDLTPGQRDEIVEICLNSIFNQDLMELDANLSFEDVQDALKKDSWEEAIWSIISHVCPANKIGVEIWGDKSPRNIKHLDLLSSGFPFSRFLHIIRDPRDRALSANQAWGTNIFLSAEQWREQTAHARFMGRQFGRNYLEIKYEDLTHNPAAILKTVTDWLQIEFSPQLTLLQSPANHHGPLDSITRSSLEVVSDNKEKFLQEFTKSQLRRFEEIVLPVCKELDYEIVSESIAYRPLGRIQKKYLESVNLLSSTWIHMRDYGIKRGLQFSWERFRMLSIRNHVSRTGKV